eukprot:452771_1
MAFFLNQGIKVLNELKEEPSMMAYYSSLESLQEYGAKCNARQIDGGKPFFGVRNCAFLSKWIYDADVSTLTGGWEKYDFQKIIKCNGSTKVSQWAFLQYNKEAYIVFKGTDVTNIQDIMGDLNAVPSPLYPEHGDKEISVHGGMELNVRRDYDEIKQYIKERIKYIDRLYITGHSLGGGLATIFGLKYIIDGCLPLNDINKTIKIVTFGAPAVVAVEKDCNKLSLKSKEYLSILHSITHCFVNRFDIVPRILSDSGVKWIDFVDNESAKLFNTLAIAKHFGNKYLLSEVADEDTNVLLKGVDFIKTATIGWLGNALISLVKDSAESSVRTVNYVKNTNYVTHRFESDLNLKIKEFLDDEYKTAQHNDTDEKEKEVKFDGRVAALKWFIKSLKANSTDLLLLYHPFGTYYFYMSQCEPCIASKYQNESKKILSYIPSRLSYNVESMKMLLSNHSMSEYRRLFRNCKQMKNDKNNPEWFVSGYMQQIKFGILNGVKCGSGAAFW